MRDKRFIPEKEKNFKSCFCQNETENEQCSYKNIILILNLNITMYSPTPLNIYIYFMWHE